MENSMYNLLLKLREYVPDYKLMYLPISNAYISAVEHNYIKKDDRLYKCAQEMNEDIPTDKIYEIDEELKSYSIEGLKKIVISTLETISSNRYGAHFNDSSNEDIFYLVYAFLGLNESGHIFYDMGSGDGYFLTQLVNKAYKDKVQYKDIIGKELNIDKAYVSKMALAILSNESQSIKVDIGSVFEIANFPYTKAFVFPPFGMKNLFNGDYKESKVFPDLKFNKLNTGEWLFIDQMLSGISGDWTAAAIVTGKALFSDADKEYRNKLIEAGLLKAVIELPGGVLSTTSIKIYMLIFSSNNKKVKFLDESEIYGKDVKRYRGLESRVNDIIEDYKNSAKEKSLEELKGVNSIVPSTVTLNIEDIENGVKLSTVAKVFSGSQYTEGVFKQKGLLSDDNTTGYKILTSFDIKDEIIDWNNLKSIKPIKTTYDEYAIQKNDVILTSKSSKVKIAVVDFEPREKIIVTGGMIIIRPNIDKVNPTYIKMYLDSNKQAALKKIQKGSVIFSINYKDLQEVKIPLIDIKKQNEMAAKYSEKLSSLFAFTKEVEKLKQSLENLYDVEMEHDN